MSENERISKFIPLIRSLYNEVRSNLGFEPHASISVVSDADNAQNPLGKTAYYSPSEEKIALYTSGRHIKDILRSLAHELVHHNQNCRGDFNNVSETGTSYAQEDEHLREMEREAYEMGNMLFRDWEDNLKKKDGKPLFSSTIPYVPAMTSDVGVGPLFEETRMTDKITKSQLRQIVENEMKKQLDEQDGTKGGGRRASAGMEPLDIGDLEVPKLRRKPRYSRNYIKKIQQMLNQIDGVELKVDGILGKRTRAAVKQFQKVADLAVDGLPGKNTLAQLQKIKSVKLPGAKITAKPEPRGGLPVKKKQELPDVDPSIDLMKGFGDTLVGDPTPGKKLNTKKMDDLANYYAGKKIKENNMSNKLIESQLRSIIRNVIQEMFDEDLNEDNMGMPADAEEQEAMTTMAQSMEEDLQSTKGHFSDTMRGDKTETHVDYEDDTMMEENMGKWLDICAKKLKKPRGSLGVKMCAKKNLAKEKSKKMEESEEINEDSGEKEKKNYEKNVKDDEKHIKKLEKDEKYDKDNEKLEESKSSNNKDLRSKARQMTNEALMKRWGYTKKEK
jgi:hypothetical protein